ATRSVDNGPRVIDRPNGAWPQVPPGFKITEFAKDMENPREVVTAPNGDLFVAESEPGRIKVLRDANGDGKAETVQVFASGLDQPFGLAFYPPGPDPRYLYVGNTGSVVRFPYQNGELHAGGPAQMIVPDIPSGGRVRGGGDWARGGRVSRGGGQRLGSLGPPTQRPPAPRPPPRPTP